MRAPSELVEIRKYDTVHVADWCLCEPYLGLFTDAANVQDGDNVV